MILVSDHNYKMNFELFHHFYLFLFLFFRELLLLLHEHLRASVLALTAATLLEETQLTPLPSLDAPSSLAHQGFGQSTPIITCNRRSGL